MRVAIIADDLTGLNAIASEFQRFGLRVATCLSVDGLAQLSSYDVVGLDTNTRSMSSQEAANTVRDAAALIAAMKPEWVFKQNDSALHGHIAAEFTAVMAGMGEDRMIFCPASPSAGRTTSNGWHRMGEASEIELLEWWRSQKGEHEGLTLVDCSSDTLKIGPGISAADAETDTDIDRVVAFAARGGHRLIGGSVGFAKALARHLWAQERRKPALLILGSFQGRTRAQAELFLSSVPATICDLKASAGGAAATLEVEAVMAALLDGRHAVLRPAPSTITAGRDGYPYLDTEALVDIGTATREIGRQVLAKHAGRISGVVLAGGLTSEIGAREILGLNTFYDVTYLDDGVAAALSAKPDGSMLPVVTKAGNWGGDDVLLRAVEWIQTAQAKEAGNAALLRKHS